MKEKKKNKKEIEPRSEKYFPTVWVEEQVRSLKPTGKGKMLYKDALQYLVRTMEHDSPLFEFVLGLASFATANKLSPLQMEKADEIIRYYIKKGVL